MIDMHMHSTYLFHSNDAHGPSRSRHRSPQFPWTIRSWSTWSRISWYLQLHSPLKPSTFHQSCHKLLTHNSLVPSHLIWSFDISLFYKFEILCLLVPTFLGHTFHQELSKTSSDKITSNLTMKNTFTFNVLYYRLLFSYILQTPKDFIKHLHLHPRPEPHEREGQHRELA